MKPWIKAHPEKILLLSAGLTLLASAGWCWQREAVIRRLRSEHVAVHLAGSSYEPTPLKQTDGVAPVWTLPEAQSHGVGWRYEVFTPPVIYYSAAAKAFTVMLASGSAVREASWDIELVGVKPEPFRLQLAGYFGAPGDYLAAFSRPGSPEVLLARVGHNFGKLGLKLMDFQVTKVPVRHDDAWPVHDVAALAVLRDETTGEEVVLDNRIRKFTERLLAVCKAATRGAQLHELHEGEILSVNASDYRVDRIQLSPAEAVMTRLPSGSASPETKVFRLNADKS